MTAKPKFEKINGTKVSYATNTAAQVLLIDGKFYAVDSGVWFMANNATGPWSVCRRNSRRGNPGDPAELAGIQHDSRPYLRINT